MQDLHFSDFKKTAWMGALRFGIPIGSWILIGRIMILRHGVQILGLWGMLASAATLALFPGTGFASYLIRSGAASAENQRRAVIYGEVRDARRLTDVFSLVFLILIVPVCLIRMDAVSNAGMQYSDLLTAILLTGCTLFPANRSRINGALLASLGLTHRTRSLELTAGILFSATALFGSFTKIPLTMFSIARLLETLLLNGLLLRNLNRIKAAEGSRHPAPAPDYRGLLSRSAPFHGFSGAVQARHSFMTLAVNLIFGLAAGGTWELCMRLTGAFRGLSTFTLSSLHGGFASLYQAGDFKRIKDLLKQALLLSALIPLPLFLLFTPVKEMLLRFWLEDVPAEMTSILPWVILWTLFNISLSPFVIFLLSTGKERLCLWMIMSLLGIQSVWMFLCGLWNFSLFTAIGGWFCMSALLQIGIGFAALKQLVKIHRESRFAF